MRRFQFSNDRRILSLVAALLLLATSAVATDKLDLAACVYLIEPVLPSPATFHPTAIDDELARAFGPATDSELELFMADFSSKHVRDPATLKIPNKYASANGEILGISPEQWAEAENGVVMLRNKYSESQGGTAVVGQDLYVEGFFRQKRVMGAGPWGPVARDIADQPWLRWTGKNFVFEKTGADRALLEKIASRNRTSTLKLYRGTGPEWDELVALMKDPAGLRAKVETLTTTNRQLLFFSQDLQVATAWASREGGKVVSVEIPFDSLRKLVDKKALFIGIEYNTPEFAFIGEEGFRAVLSK
jgi:hypothetical protein